MRYYSLFLLVALTVGFCIWQQQKPTVNMRDMAKAQLNTGIKWNDSLMKHLPKNLDTTIVVKDIHGTPLKFAQYIAPVFNHEALIYQDRGTWRLYRLTESANDSLRKEVNPVATAERWSAYRDADTISSWKVKLNNLATTLAQADYILVLKSQRKMLVQRKGKTLKTFPINMGWAPIGNKEKEGDGKTPEGIYHLDIKYERKDKFYKSFWISYPNEEDKRIAKSRGFKPGSGVSIHGTTPGKTKAKDWTAGCIALQNADIDTLFAHVAEGTLIEIRK